jgi:hypothetical protein
MLKIFIQGIIAGFLSGIAGVIYFYIYQSTLMTAFDELINPTAILGASVFGCLLMSLGYAFLYKTNKAQFKGWLNLLIAVLSFASIISPISMSLPLTIESPELFPGLVAAMHFFPALAFFAIAPFFETSPASNK